MTLGSSSSSSAAAPSPPPCVVVVGGGLAGLSASIEALDRGARVVLVEKQPSVGGNSAKATSGINGAGTIFQGARSIPDSAQALREETLASGRGLSDPVLVDVLAQGSAHAIAWLAERFQLDLSALAQLGGHSLARTHRVPPAADGRPVPVGAALVKALWTWLEKQQQPEGGGEGRLTVRTSSRVAALDVQDQEVKGVRLLVRKEAEAGGGAAEETEEVLAADAVVLASGGYAYGSDDGSAASLLQLHAPPSTRLLPTTNGPFATGDGIRLGVSVGAEVSLMDQVQVHPTAFSGPVEGGMLASRSKFLAPEALRGGGGLLVDHEGRRFVNELDYRDRVTAAMLQHCRPMPQLLPQQQTGSGGGGVQVVECYLVLNEASASAFGLPAILFYQSRGLLRRVEDASASGLPHLSATLEAYSAVAQTGGPDEFGKRSFPAVFSVHEPLYLAPVTPAIHYTMGGLKIDSQARVQSRGSGGQGEERPIKGLFAAGEVTGGLHGANRLGGNSLLECVVFGRIAGANAATIKEAAAAGAKAGISSPL